MNDKRIRDATDGIAAAAAHLRVGGLVAFPTETVYGLGADATNGAGVAAIFAAKGRPAFNPLIVHVADLAAAEAIAEIPAPLVTLAQAFWPGPLTLVAPQRADGPIHPLVTAGLDSVALRVPAAPVAQALLREAGRPIAAPSANASGRISPTHATHVAASLTAPDLMILDGGPTRIGLESTIVGLKGNRPLLLREGGLARERIEAVLGSTLAHADGDTISAPGQLLSHYAPKTGLRLNVTVPHRDEAYLAFGAMPDEHPGLSLSDSADLNEAAANLFGHLHRLDALVEAAGLSGIAAAPVPDHGLGRAINDRLQRAAAPRSMTGHRPGAPT